jgi:succinoglycan biosynthesis protein ExoA
MRISVIVPVLNEAANIRQTLYGLARQTFPANEFEILVVDGRSTDGTSTIVWELQREIPNLHLFDNPKRLASAARNIGVQNARGECIVIVDGHCQVNDPHLLSRLADAFEFSGADTLGRPQPLAAANPTAFQRAVSAARSSWLGHNPDSAIYSEIAGFLPPDNVAVAYRRDVFNHVGLFDESFDACEDVEFNTRVRLAGLTCYFTPAIAVAYQPRTTLRGLFYQLARYGRGRAKLARKHPATLSPPSLVPSLWLIWLFASALIGAIWPPLSWVFLGTVAIYLSVLLAESARVWLSKSNAPLVRLPLVFAAIHVGFGWGYLAETMSGITQLLPTLLNQVVRPVQRITQATAPARSASKG